MNSKSKGFFTADALICFVIVLIITSFLIVFEKQGFDLNGELLYAQAQDLVEACTIKKDLTDGCFSFFREITGFDYCLNNCSSYSSVDALIKRDYVEFGAVRS